MNPEFSAEKELHRQYLDLMRQYHPDHNSSPEAHAHCIKIQNDYEQCKKILKSRKELKYELTLELYDAIRGCQRMLLHHNTRFTINILPGIRHGETVAFSGESLNLTVTFRVVLPVNYCIANNKLIYRMRLNWWTRRFGGIKKIRLVNGEWVRVRIPKKTDIGKIFEMVGEGLYNRAEKRREALRIEIFGIFG